MLKYISSAWKTFLETAFPSPERFYIDFRMLEYPNISGTPVYTLVDGTDNRPGTFNMTDGYSTHLISLVDGMTFDILSYADFNYDVATDQPLHSWYKSATQYLKIFYNATTDKITIAWKDGGTERTLESAAYTSGLNEWYRITVVFSTTSPLLYIDGVLADDSWSGSADALASNFDQMQIRAYNGTEGTWTINYVRLFSGYSADATAIGNNYLNVKNEEIFFDLDGNQVGKTRCNITEFGSNFTYEAAAENEGGSQVANRATITLMSPNGEFADDQYAAFDLTADQFNGTSAQKYLQQRCRVEIETWYLGDFEPIIRGHVDGSHFSRYTDDVKHNSTVTIGIEDYVALIANTFKDKSYGFEDFYLCSNDKQSLLHSVTRLATRKQVTNYLCDSGFENVTELIENGTSEEYNQYFGWENVGRGPYIRGDGFGQFIALKAGYVLPCGFTTVARNGEWSTAVSITTYVASGTAISETRYFHSGGTNLRGLTPGTEYTGTIYVYNPTTYGATSITLFMYDDVNGLTSDTTTTLDAWTELTVTHTVNASAKNILFGVSYALTSDGNGFRGFCIDDVTLQPSANNTWAETGSVTFTRDATYAHTGSYSGKLVFGGAGSIYQTLMFEQPLYGNIGDVHTASIYAYATGAFTGTLRLAEHDSVGSNDDSTVSIALSGGEGWTRFIVTHEITDEDSDRLVYTIEGTTGTVWIDTTGLGFGDLTNSPYVINDHDGEAGITRPQYAKTLGYDYLGINADGMEVLHPYALVPKNESTWEHVKQIGDACGARILGADHAGVITMKTHLVAVDPTPTETVDIPWNIATQLQDESANKIIISGVNIVKNQNDELFWQASACEEFKQYPYVDRDGKLAYKILTPVWFPESGEYIDVLFSEVG